MSPVIDEQTVIILLGFAGVAATFTGFSGVVAVFAQRARGEWFPEERFRLTNMMLISLAACLFAFVPLVEALLHLPEPALWESASILMCAFCVTYLLCALPLRRRLHRTRHGALPMWATAVFVLSLVLAAVLQVLNAAAALFVRGAGPYVAGLLLLLIIAGLQFAFLVLTPLSSVAKRESK